MYKYVNKKDISITVGEISFTPYSGYTSTEAVVALDTVSNGWDFDRYINGALNNSNNDIAGESKILITGTKNIYVSTTGDNGNSGDIDSPFRTIQYAMDYIAKYYRFGYISTNMCNINIADGTYEEETLIVPVFNEVVITHVTLLGNITTLNSVILYTTTSSYYSIKAISGLGSSIQIKGITLDATRLGNYGVCVYCTNRSIVSIGEMVKLKLWSGITGFYVSYYSRLNLNYYNLTLEGAARRYFDMGDSSYLSFSPLSITLINSSATYFIDADTNVTIYYYNGSIIGTFTGDKYNIRLRSMLMLDSSDTLIPGTTGVNDATSVVVTY